ncbi:MAG: diguanylate cyclase [Clostridium sp.]|nr:diguanylate cyclase [Clostridium sp.]
MKIRKRFIEIIILLSIIPLILTAILYLVIFNRSSERLSEQLISVASDNQSKVLDDFFNSNIMELSTLSQDKSISELFKYKDGNIDKLEDISDKESYKLLMKYRQEHFLDSISVVDDNGIVIISTNREYIGKNNVISESDIRKLEKSGNLISNRTKEKNIISDTGIIIAVPIFNQGVYYGAVIEVIDIKTFSKLINSAHIFTDGQVSVFDEDSNLVLSDEVDKNLSLSDVDLYENIKVIRLNSIKSGLIKYKYGSSRMVGYYSILDVNGWLVLLSYDESKLELPFRNAFNMTIIIIIIVIISIIIVNLQAIKQFSKPIEELIRVMKEIEEGKFNERFIYVKNNELGMVSKAFNKLINKINLDNEIIEKYNEDLELMIKNIPGGMYSAKVCRDKLKSFYVSEHYLKITGNIMNKDKNIYTSLIKSAHEKDKEKVIDTLKRCINNREDFDIDYRVVKSDGSIVWIKNRGRIVTYKNESILHGVIIDITEEKNAIESLMISEEKYHIICEHVDDLFFQWNSDKDELNVCEKWRETFKYEPVEDNLLENLVNSKNIYKEDISKIIDMIKKLYEGTKKAESEIRILTKDDTYIWVKIKATGIFDNEDNLKRVMGLVMNINDEKVEKERLIFEAQRDGLTRLYNKTNTEFFIDEYIKEEGKHKSGGLFILDLDDFKSINDKMGHINGDKALTIVAENLRRVFGENNIIGRVGGDEFIVLLKDADYNQIVKCAEKIAEVFKNKYADPDFESDLSTSIGISMYPQDGSSFKELYKNADKALYNTKLKGKNGYCIYNKEIFNK